MISGATARRPRAARATILAAALTLAACGCARSAARPAGASEPRAASTGAAVGGAGAATRPAGDASQAAVAQAPAALDPAEEMTPEELATIPEPVPPARDVPTSSPVPPASAAAGDAGTAVGGDSVGGGGEAPPAADLSADGPGGGLDGNSAREGTAGGIWRVQVFASPERAQANRVSKEAATRLGASAVVELEGGLYKVRLGAFASESDAQPLRDRAVREGYPGAFRVHGKAGASPHD